MTIREKTVFQRIIEMNTTFEVPVNFTFTDHGTERIAKFRKIVGPEHGEMKELCEVYNELGGETDRVALADYLADQVVFHLSEAVRWGIDLESVLHAVLDSQESKLVDGKPIWNEDRSKFLKGPNFVAPDAAIRKIVQ